jgi:branched-chain amino acid transport system substrate-binding protein
VFSLYAARGGEAALDRLSDGDPNPNSVFTRVLAPALTRPGVDLAALALDVREEVARIAATAGHAQRPAYSDETIGGRVYLAGAPSREQLPREQPRQPQANESPAKEPQPSEASLAWAAVQNSNSLAVLDDYIRQFGNAPIYGALARERREKLAKEQVAVVVTPSPSTRPATKPSGEPIRIGFGISMTGPLAPNGKSALLAHKIWEEDVNARGGILGRPVRLVTYDDQSNPSTVPGIYTKLLDVDKTDLVIGPYATSTVAPAMPVVMAKNKVLIGLLALGVNSEFRYPNYFAMIPSGSASKTAFTEGFFDVALAQNPKPATVALVASDSEFSRNACDGARENAARAKLKITYDRSYPPAGTTDFAPIVRAIAATNPDLVVVCSYPLDSVGIVKAVNEAGFRPKQIGGAMVGLQATTLKAQLGPLLNGFVNYDLWLPAPKLQFPGVNDLLQKYQARAQAEGVDPLGYYVAPWAYAQLQVLQQAIEGTQSLDDRKLSAYIHANTFHTVVGDVRFGADGEWAQARMLQVQFHDVKGNSIEQFRTMGTQTVVAPAAYKSGDLIYPYEKAK